MGIQVIYAARRLHDAEGFEIQPHNIGHMRPTLGRLVIEGGLVSVRKKHDRRTKWARLVDPERGTPIEGFEMFDVVVESASCGRVMVYGKQRTEIGSRVQITGQAWWLEAESSVQTED